LELSPQLIGRMIGSAAAALTRRQNDAGESVLGDVLADAVQAGSVTWGENVASIVSLDELHADLVAHPPRDPGGSVEITFGAAYAAVPLDQAATTVTLTGAGLLAALEQQFDLPDRRRRPTLQVSQGFHYAWDPRQPAGRIVDPGSVTIGGSALDPAATYRVTVGNLLLHRRGGVPALAAATPITAGRYGQGGAVAGRQLDLLAGYLSTRSPLAAPPLDRITRLDG
jgi:5'-nucleotidase